MGQLARFERRYGCNQLVRRGSHHAIRFATALAVAGFVVASLAPVSIAADATVKVDRLRCEYLENPLGIDVATPRLSWNLAAVDPAARGIAQTAYQVLVASSAEKLAADEGDLWDSGRVESDRSIQIKYAGKPLASHAEAFWKVRVWDQAGSESAWSDPAHWSMGMLDPADWHAKWIGIDGDDVVLPLSGTNWIWYPDGNAAQAVPPGNRYFRRTFELPADRRVMRARYLSTGDDQVKAFINTRDIGGRDNYRTVKDSDLTHDLKPGKNLLAVLGMNKGDKPTPAGLVGILTIEFDSGEPLVILTDDRWKSSDAEVEGWNMDPNFDDSAWKPAKVTGPVGMQPWGDVRAPEDRRLPARYARKEFTNDKPIRRATVTLSGLGLSELYLNGKKVGDAVLSPGVTEYPKRALYVTHDVTDQIKSGENALGVILGNGRYYSMRSRVYSGMPHYGYPKLLLNLRIEHEDGSIEEIVSDETWRITDDGPILANNEYDGEEYDARKEFSGWAEPGFDDSAWQQAPLAKPAEGEISAEIIDPIRVVETIKPIAVTEPTPGTFIFDMGQNLVGWCQLKVSGPAGTTVTLRHAETLNPDGTLYLANIRGAKVTDKYTLRGQKRDRFAFAPQDAPHLPQDDKSEPVPLLEVWEPRFTYHGFRFVEVTGYPGTPTLDTLTGRVVHDDLQVVGQFECSNELVNQIYKNVVWGTRGNYRSIPTDCPQRDERQGWLGDRSEESKGESYMYDISALFSKWLQDMEDSQRDSGSVPDVCPAHWPIYSDNVTWPSSTVIIPNMLRRQYGDETIIARHYDSAKKWVDYMLQFVDNGIISKDSYGDWCVPPEDPNMIHSKDPARITDKALLATSYFYFDLRLMQQFATMLGKSDDAARYGKLADELKTAFNDRFFNREKGQYDNGTQTSCVLPLRFGLVPEGEEDRVFERLISKITHETNNHIGTGLIGGQYLNQVLSDHGRADLSYTIASQSDYPSWGYMVKEGATTIWELWNGNTAEPSMNSGNHVMLVGDLVTWFYEYLAGIAPDDANPGFKHIVMRPHPVGDLTFVKASFLSPYGTIRSAWERNVGGVSDADAASFAWQITVPPNTTATIHMPAKAAAAVTESGKPAADAAGVKFVRQDDNHAVYEIASGTYNFKSE
jgi:alpha-L-rhamnosidase